MPFSWITSYILIMYSKNQAANIDLFYELFVKRKTYLSFTAKALPLQAHLAGWYAGLSGGEQKNSGRAGCLYIWG
jgi:hypothetical protein